jgi:hypothetical protein
MVAGKLNCTVECNPLIGPQIFDAVEARSWPAKTLEQAASACDEGVYDQSKAAEALPTRQY